MNVAKRYPSVLLATCLLPWTERFEFDEPLFREQVRRARQELTPHLYLFGTAGEGYAISDQQFDHIIRVFRDEMPPESHPMIGLIGLSLPAIVERIERAGALGFRAFQLSLPSWGELNDREVDEFFRQTCGQFPACAFLHYNVRRAKRLLVGDDYARLAAAHPNLVAVKMGGEDEAALIDVLAKAPALQGFFTEFGFAALRDRYECGYLVALGLMHFGRARAFFEARGSDLAARGDEFRVIHRALKTAAGPDARIDGAYDKLYARLREPRFPLRLLPPYEGMSEDVFTRFRAGLPPGWLQ